MVEHSNGKILMIVGGQAYPPSVGGTPSILYGLLKDIDPNRIDVLTEDSHNAETNKTLPFPTIRIPKSRLITVRILWHFHVVESAIRFFLKSFQLMRRNKYGSVLLLFPETAPLVGGWLATMFNKQIYDLYVIDLMADSRIYKIEWILLRLTENRMLKHARTVFSLTKGITDLYNQRVARDYISLPHIATNIQPNAISDNTKRKDTNIIITFSGQIHEISRDALQNLIQAVRLLHETSDIRVTVQLFTNQSLESLEKTDLLDTFVKVKFFNSKEDLMAALRESTILFSPVAFNPRYPLQAETCFPTKTFDYIIAERPILVHGRASYFYTQYMRDSHSAYVVDEFDKESLKNGIIDLLNQPELQAELINNASHLAQNNHADDMIRQRFEEHVFANKES